MAESECLQKEQLMQFACDVVGNADFVKLVKADIFSLWSSFNGEL